MVHRKDNWRFARFKADAWSQVVHLKVWRRGWLRRTAFMESRSRSHTSISRTSRPLNRLRKVTICEGRIWNMISWRWRTVSDSGFRLSNVRWWSQSSRMEQSYKTRVSSTCKYQRSDLDVTLVSLYFALAHCEPQVIHVYILDVKKLKDR